MAKRKFSIDIPSLNGINRSRGLIAHQLVQKFREAITKREIKPGERLPSTRSLSESLGVSRGTVTEVFDQLIAEGYLEAKVGSGTRVAQNLQNELSPVAVTKKASRAPNRLPANVEKYSRIAKGFGSRPQAPFAIAVPAGEVALDDNWRRIGNRVRATSKGAPSMYQDPQGVLALRKEVSEYVRRARSVSCKPEQVIITSGTQQGLYLASMVLLSPGNDVWLEDPVYAGLAAVLGEFQVNTIPVPVDEEGLDVSLAEATCRSASAAFVTPSHQYPLGMVMSMRRRAALIAWAEKQNAWIVEDDYDSELRYAGHPFPALQGLAPDRVVYLGTFSKVLFPSLRLGYAIVPEPLVDAFAGARAIIDRHSPTADQHVVAAYMREGFFEAHIRKIRSAYSSRRLILIDAISKELSGLCKLQPSDQGMHVIVWLSRKVNDVAVANEASKLGIVVRPVSPLYASTKRRSGLMLGFGAFSQGELTGAVKKLRSILKA